MAISTVGRSFGKYFVQGWKKNLLGVQIAELRVIKPIMGLEIRITAARMGIITNRVLLWSVGSYFWKGKFNNKNCFFRFNSKLNYKSEKIKNHYKLVLTLHVCLKYCQKWYLLPFSPISIVLHFYLIVALTFSVLPSILIPSLHRSTLNPVVISITKQLRSLISDYFSNLHILRNYKPLELQI